MSFFLARACRRLQEKTDLQTEGDWERTEEVARFVLKVDFMADIPALARIKAVGST